MAQASPRVCLQCGTPIVIENQRFCNKCGATIVDAPVAPQQDISTQNTVQPLLPPLMPNMSPSPQFPSSQQIPTISGTPPPSQHIPTISGTPAQATTPHLPPQHIPPAQGAHFQAAARAHPAPFHAPSTAQPGQPAFPTAPHAPVPPQPGLPTSHIPGTGAVTRRATKAAAQRAARAGVRLLLKKPLVTALVAVVVAGSGVGYAAFNAHANAPSSFVIATDRGNNQIDRIDLATRAITVLLSNKVLPGSPDTAVFLDANKVLISFLTNGELGIGDIQQNTYHSLGTGFGTALRDMALRPDGSGVLISDAGGTILEYHADTQKVTTFVSSLGGVQGLAFDAHGALYAAVGTQVIQLDPTNGKQLKTFALPDGSDGMAFDSHHNALDIAVGKSIMALNLQTQKLTSIVDGLGGPDGLAIDRQGNLFIADSIGILQLTLDNKLLLVGTNSNGVVWDDVAPLSGAGAANY